MAMVLFVVGMTTLSSCTKSKAELILGKWQFDKAVASYGDESFQMSASDLVAMLDMSIDVEDLVIEFKSDGRVYAAGESEPASYTIDGDKLTIITPEESFQMVITKLTSTMLILEPQYEVEDMEDVKVEIDFKRV